MGRKPRELLAHGVETSNWTLVSMVYLAGVLQLMVEAQAERERLPVPERARLLQKDLELASAPVRR